MNWIKNFLKATKNNKKISVFDIDKYIRFLPDEFYGRWENGISIHNADAFLVVGCAPNERGAMLMNRDEVLFKAEKLQAKCLKMQELAFEDFSISLKK